MKLQVSKLCGFFSDFDTKIVSFDLQMNDGDESTSNGLNTVRKESTATGFEKSIESITQEIVERFLDQTEKQESQSRLRGSNVNLPLTTTGSEKSIESITQGIIDRYIDQMAKQESQTQLRSFNVNLPMTAIGLEKSIESIAQGIIDRHHDQMVKQESQSRGFNVNLPLAAASEKSIESVVERVVKQKVKTFFIVIV